MIASLNHRRSLRSIGSRWDRAAIARPSISGGRARSPDAPDRRGAALRIEADTLGAAPPVEARPRDQLLDADLRPLIDAELGEGQRDVGLVGMVRIDVHGDPDHVLARGVRLAIEQNVGIARRIEAQVLVVVEGGIVPADPVEAGDEAADIAGTVPVPGLDLVFLRIEILLAARNRRRLAQLEAAIDAPE